MKRVIWFCSWYPNQLDAFSGDFIQRQAEATSLHTQIDLLYVHKVDNQQKYATEIKTADHGRLTETILYNSVKPSAWGKLLGLINYFLIHRNYLKAYLKKYGKPHAIHVQIPIKSGVMALYAKWFLGIPYVVTEHYGIYNFFLNDHYFGRSWWYKFFTKLVVKNAKVLTTVSDSLGKDMNQAVIKKPYVVVPNVVDTTLFHFTPPSQPNPFKFLHISNMIPLKNVSGIIEAFERVKLEFPNGELHIIGRVVEEYRSLAQQKGLLNQSVFFKGEVAYHEIAEEIKRAHSLIIFSDTESQSCVVLESLCIGRPAIVTNIGGVKELIREDNGLRVEVRDEDDLVEKMKYMMAHYTDFDQKRISQKAITKFSYEEVGKQFAKIYSSL